MKAPLVSICIPTYNGETYLRECLNSCIDQSFKDFEIIICDDRSSDGTIAIIEEYKKTHTAIIFFQNEKNLGLVGNWNRCIENAGGEWIKFVFQDDFISRDCLQEFAAAIEPSTVLLVSARHFILPKNSSEETFDYYQNGVRTLINTTKYAGNTYPGKLISSIAVENMCMNFIGEPSLSFFRKAIVSEIGYFNPSLKQICDLEYLLRVASRYGLKYVPKQICAFRIHEKSTTSSNIETKFFELKYIEPILLAYFLLFGKDFKSFREHLNVLHRIKLILYFKVKTYRAYQVNLKEKHDYYVFNESNTDFKEIAQCKKGNFLIRLIERVL